MKKKIAAGLLVAFLAGYGIGLATPHFRSWLKIEPSVQSDEKFFTNRFSVMFGDNFTVIGVGKIEKTPAHPWQPEPTGAFAVIRQGVDTHFLWYDDLDKHVLYRTVRLDRNAENIVTKVYEQKPEIGITKIIDLTEGSHPYETLENTWTENMGKFVIEFAEPPDYGFYETGPPTAFNAILITENGTIVGNEPIKRIV